jgi:hypothetical protein
MRAAARRPSRVHALAASVLLAGTLAASARPAVAAADCADACLLGDKDGSAVCALWDQSTSSWVGAVDDGAGHLHNRARGYLPWLRERLMPAGGVMRAIFTDDSYRNVFSYGGERDSAIWTGAYLAAESLRLMATGSEDAERQVTSLLETLDRWWRISGDKGYLARYAAPEDSAQAVLDILALDDPEVVSASFEGRQWRWRGDTSRDQYQGVLLGFALAYDAIDDERLRALIRARVVEFAERLMQREKRTVLLRVNGGSEARAEIDMRHVVYSDDFTDGGTPRLDIRTSPFEVTGHGILVFWPTPTDFVRQLPGLGWLPEVRLPTQAIQLAAAFRVALHVTDGAPDYAARRQALLAHYERHVAEWLDIASEWQNRNDCGAAYFGFNIAYMPAWNWARLETDAGRAAMIRREVLRDGLWAESHNHKNVLFAFLYASQAPPEDTTDAVVARHAAQLDLFPAAPNLDLPRDLRGEYPEDSSCRGLSSVAIDVDDRVPSAFIWERDPWRLYSAGTPNRLFPGVDYLLAYWLGRHTGLIADDAPGTCLRWRGKLPPETAIPAPGGWRAILQ